MDVSVFYECTSSLIISIFFSSGDFHPHHLGNSHHFPPACASGRLQQLLVVGASQMGGRTSLSASSRTRAFAYICHKFLHLPEPLEFRNPLGFLQLDYPEGFCRMFERRWIPFPQISSHCNLKITTNAFQKSTTWRALPEFTLWVCDKVRIVKYELGGSATQQELRGWEEGHNGMNRGTGELPPPPSIRTLVCDAACGSLPAWSARFDNQYKNQYTRTLLNGIDSNHKSKIPLTKLHKLALSAKYMHTSAKR